MGWLTTSFHNLYQTPQKKRAQFPGRNQTKPVRSHSVLGMPEVLIHPVVTQMGSLAFCIDPFQAVDEWCGSYTKAHAENGNPKKNFGSTGETS